MADELLLVVAAHPDDEVLGCGATLARLVREGVNVHVAILGEGLTSRTSWTQDQAHSEREALEANARRASQVLGVEHLHRFHLPDNKLDTVALLDVVKIVEGLIGQLQPATILTHSGSDLNVDHQTIFRAVLTATRPIKGMTVRQVLSFEVPSATEWAFNRIAPSFTPEVFYDVEHTLEQKIQAMAAYEGESRTFPHPRSPDALRALAAWRGASVGLAAAEAFEVVRDIR